MFAFRLVVDVREQERFRIDEAARKRVHAIRERMERGMLRRHELESDESYAQRLFISTVETEGYRYDGMVHGFLRMAGVVDRSNTAIDEISESLKAALEKGYSV